MKSNGLILSILVGLAIVGASIFAYSEFKHDDATVRSAEAPVCATKGQQLRVTIANDEMQPKHVEGKLCDTLTITNAGPFTRKIGFGQHDHHTAYDGVAEKLLASGESLTITLNKAGQFSYHDHYHEEVAGTFTVTK